MQVTERVSHGELALAAYALGVVVSGAVHAVDAHLSRIGTLFTLETVARHITTGNGTADAVEAVGACLALGADRSANRRGVRAFPARHALAIRGSVRVLADGALDTL